MDRKNIIFGTVELGEVSGPQPNAASYSPHPHSSTAAGPQVMSNETKLLKRQSRKIAARLESAGVSPRVLWVYDPETKTAKPLPRRARK